MPNQDFVHWTLSRQYITPINCRIAVSSMVRFGSGVFDFPDGGSCTHLDVFVSCLLELILTIQGAMTGSKFISLPMFTRNLGLLTMD